jgi:hypothetical protein
VSNAAAQIFPYTLGCTVDPLAAVDELVLESLDTLGNLSAWLRRRAAEQRVVRSLEFRRCQALFGNRATFTRYVQGKLGPDLVISVWSDDVYGDDD